MEMTGRKRSWSNLKNHYGNCMKRLKKTMTTPNYRDPACCSGFKSGTSKLRNRNADQQTAAYVRADFTATHIKDKGCILLARDVVQRRPFVHTVINIANTQQARSSLTSGFNLIFPSLSEIFWELPAVTKPHMQRTGHTPYLTTFRLCNFDPRGTDYSAAACQYFHAPHVQEVKTNATARILPFPLFLISVTDVIMNASRTQYINLLKPSGNFTYHQV
jgi:hypothetical protein